MDDTQRDGSGANSTVRTATTTAIASPDHGASSGRGRAVVIGIVALLIVGALGWILAGLPGLHSPNALGIALIVAALISGGLTLIFVVDALRKARKREQASVREMVVVVICAMITGVIALVQLIQTIQQLP